MPLLVHSTLQGFATLLDEALVNGTDLEPQAWGQLRAAYNTLFDTFLGRPPARDEEVPMPPPRSTSEGERDALRRWTRGHYVFMSIVQGLSVVLNGLTRDINASDIPSAQVNFERATTIMMGAESALRFTGDYSYNAYEKSVRPTLMPPIAPPGMTGLRWRDHEHLVKILSGMRPLFSALDPALEPYREAFYASISHTYDSHKLVCSSFVGTERTSLLMAERTEKSAIEILDHFKRVRLQLVKS
ncbi:hypothetical protein HV824_08925 [Myxococcus sp. AM009]|uniref:hypothetical protein n=1 Tax=unclassified Myxococcus TaxID=2648731 RepID=UPI0015963B00|nr:MULTISPECIES: hypothetical protein [unclassified Myxococcus]NVI98246.1 hypothetical protein [Myxococcus sp. AM009]